jgi:MerR family redox-sensitive transcriptional activator SoxR
MLIGELARRAGIASSAIRFYEEQGLLPRAARLSGRRVFDDRSLAHLKVVRLAGDAGFTLAEIRQLVTDFGANRWRRLAERKLVEIETARQRLRAMTLLLEKLLECRCPDIEFCGHAIEKAAVRGPRRIRSAARSRVTGP